MALGHILRCRTPLNRCLQQWNNNRAYQHFSGLQQLVGIRSAPRLCLSQEKSNPVCTQSRSLCLSRTLHQEGPNNPLEPTAHAKAKSSNFKTVLVALLGAGGLGTAWYLRSPKTDKNEGDLLSTNKAKVDMVSTVKPGETTSASASSSAASASSSAASIGTAPPASTAPGASSIPSQGPGSSTHSSKASPAPSVTMPHGQQSAGDGDICQKPCPMPRRRSVPRKYVHESSATKVVRGRCDCKSDGCDSCNFNNGANDPVTHPKPCMSSKN